MQGPPTGPDDDLGAEEEGAIFSEINITPLTDVFIVLLIIFMVVSSSMVEAEKETAAARNVLAERALQVTTPEGTGDAPLVPKDIVISVMPDGTIFVEDEQTSLSKLASKLGEVKRGATSTRVVIRGDETATYDLIMKVISTARGAGLTDVALASRARK